MRQYFLWSVRTLYIIFGFAIVSSGVMGAEKPVAMSLMEQAQQRGQARVIVELRGDFNGEGQLSGPAAVSAQRAGIAAAQSRILDEMASFSMGAVKKFETIPFMAMGVSPDALSALMNNPNVASVTEDTLSKPTLAQSVPFINGDDVISDGYDGSGWAVAVLDTGVRKTHVDLDNGKVVSEACYGTTDSTYSSVNLCPNGSDAQVGSGAGVNCSVSISGCSHGTHVAGIAAGDNGVAPGANIIALQVFSRFDNADICGSADPCVLSFSSDQILALERVYALRNSIDIASANMSLGGGQYSSHCDSDSPALTSIINNLRSAGIATVIASGNDGFDGFVSAPSCISQAISVGATLDSSNSISSYSNHASIVDMLAPGSNITSAVANSTTSRQSYNGTSMATPHVAGAFAVMKDADPSLSVNDIETALESTGVNITRSGVTKPRIDLAAAAATLSAPDLKPINAQVTNALPDPSASITLSMTVINEGDEASNSSTLRYYRSVDNQITTSDTNLGGDYVSALSPSATSPESIIISVPAATGVYYYGGCVDAVNGEQDQADNCSDAVRVTVSPGLVADAFEPDANQAEAKSIEDGDRQYHSIHQGGDVDWVKIDLPNGAVDFKLETHDVGFPSDTVISLFNDEGQSVGSDDDGGTGLFSRLALDTLPEGTYYASIELVSASATSEGYELSLEFTEDADILSMLPAILAGIAEPAPPSPAAWGVLTSVCCNGAPLTFTVNIGGTVKQSTIASCSSEPSFAGYSDIEAGTRAVASSLSCPGLGSYRYPNFNFPFESRFVYLFVAELSGGDPVIRVYQGTRKEEGAAADFPDEPAFTLTLDEMRSIKSRGIFKSISSE